MTRDPRVDPRAGDALRLDCRPCGWALREVDCVREDGTVEYFVGRLGYTMSLDEWCRENATAEVVTVAGEAEE